MAKPFSALQARNKYGEDTADRIPEIEKMFNLVADWQQPRLGQSGSNLESEKILRRLVANGVKYLPTAQ
jgi:hypothetical protein